MHPTDDDSSWRAATSLLLDLPGIAAWQIAHPPARPGPVIADLPSLQRDAVWKVKQIEELWDSILRGFPIGSFVFAPPHDFLGRQNYKHQRTERQPGQSRYLLLDGQQRANAIALAFDDIWARKDDTAKGALWVDLAAPSEDRGVEFIFRALTRAHPWGYQVNPEKTLSASDMRSALAAYRAVHHVPDHRPEDFSLWQTWPWAAKAPIPVAPLIAAVMEHRSDVDGVRKALWNRIQSFAFFGSNESIDRSGQANDILNGQRQNIRDAFENDKSDRYLRLQRLIDAMNVTLEEQGIGGYRVPALVFKSVNASENPLQKGEETSQTEATDQTKDAIELLFIRINSAGTPLQGEELAYSLLKAEWPEVAQWMQALPNKPALPSRIASLCVRLVLARNNTASKTESRPVMPEMPNIADFRRLLRGANENHPDFRTKLQDFITKEAKDRFETSWQFLTGPEFGILPAQAVDLANQAPEVYLLLLRWIDRLAEMKIPIDDIDPNTHRRTLGFLTALAWFAPDTAKACASLWADIEADVNAKQLCDRFNATRFKYACRLTERFTLKMIPLPSPDELENICKKFISKDGRTIETKNKVTIHFPDGLFWKDQYWWYNQFVPTFVRMVHYNNNFVPRAESEEEEPDYPGLMRQIAIDFLDTLWGARSTILLYAQRAAIKRWFPHFDPSLPDMMEDKNRPWDWDHILPQKYFTDFKGIPRSVKDWCGSIGNLRAWPMEANRADGDMTPQYKLSSVSEEENRYGIMNEKDERTASVVDETLDWPHWQKAVPTDESGRVIEWSYLSNRHYRPKDETHLYHDFRVETVTAIILRFNTLYRHWYEELRLSDLHKKLYN